MSTLRPVSVGLVTGGSWGRLVHAPSFAAGPETRLAGVWSRDGSQATAIAAAHGCPAFPDLDGLIDAAELVSVSVDPHAQPALAGAAAQAGRPVLLEKPVAVSADEAGKLADVLDASRSGSLLFLTYRFAPRIRSFIDRCRSRDPVRAGVRFLTTARGSEVTGWRRTRGLLLDLGFHVFDLLDAVAGPICRVRADGDLWRSVDLRVEHTDGCASAATVGWSGLPARRTEVEVLTGEGLLTLGADAFVRGPWLASGLRSAVWALVREGQRGAPGIEHGVYLQRCVQAAEKSLTSGRTVEV